MKNEIKHTPGPWRVEHDHTAICAGDQTLARIYHGEGRSYEESCANANLMGASTEMLEILTGLLDSIEAYHTNKPENEWDEYDYMMLPRWKAAQQLVERLK